MELTYLWILLVVAMICDLKKMQVPNILIALGYMAGIFTILWSRGPSAIPGAILGAILVLLIFYIVFWFRGLGAGDVKLLSVAGFYIGTRSAVWVMMAALIVAIIFVIFRMLIERRIILGSMRFTWCITCGYFLWYVKEVFFETTAIVAL